MAQQYADIALLTDRRYTAPMAAEGDWYLANILREDQLLRDALGELGLSAVRVDWADPDVDWSRFRCAVFRTTWDYFNRFDEFAPWLRFVETQTRLCNASSIVWWNLDKHYLADLEMRGVPVVPCRFVERDCELSVAELLDETGWSEAIIKPCISGAARHTHRVTQANANEVDAILRPLRAEEAFIFQPFQRDILTTGEDTLMVFGRRYSHAVRKVVKAGDFRVQDDFGGTVHDLVPSDEHVELAERAFAACSPVPAYGRVDVVRGNDGRLAVMELELIEPELWMRRQPEAAKAFAAAIAGGVS